MVANSYEFVHSHSYVLYNLLPPQWQLGLAEALHAYFCLKIHFCMIHFVWIYKKSPPCKTVMFFCERLGWNFSLAYIRKFLFKSPVTKLLFYVIGYLLQKYMYIYVRNENTFCDLAYIGEIAILKVDSVLLHSQDNNFCLNALTDEMYTLNAIVSCFG